MRFNLFVNEIKFLTVSGSKQLQYATTSPVFFAWFLWHIWINP